MYFVGIIDSLAISLDWETAQSFLDDPSVRLQLLLMAGLVCVTFIVTRLTKWRIHPLAENPDSPPLLRMIWAALERMVAPLFLLAFCLLTVIVFYEYHTPTHDLIRPFTSVAGAWGIFRLVSGFIKSRAWLRLVAVVAFGVATLHSFGLLGATVDLLRKLGFSIGSTEISALDLLNGIGHFTWIAMGHFNARDSRRNPHPSTPSPPAISPSPTRQDHADRPCLFLLCRSPVHRWTGLVLFCLAGWCGRRRHRLWPTEGGFQSSQRAHIAAGPLDQTRRRHRDRRYLRMDKFTTSSIRISNYA